MIVVRRAGCTALLLVPFVFAGAAHGDVTMEQSIRMEGPGALEMLNMSGTTVTSISGDRARTESDLKMESRLMRMFAGGPTAEIVRLDEDKLYQLNLKKKTYTETTFAEQREEMEKSMEQMRDAQQSQQQGASGVDESECEWSEPTATVDRSGETETIAGYAAERMTVTATQSCADPKTGQVCSFNLILDQWLAPDFELGDEVVDYFRAYTEKLGLDVAQSPDFAQRLQSMFGAYEGIWNEVAGKMAEADGYPLRSSMTLAVGGPQCETAEETQAAEASDRPGIGEAVGGALGGAIGGFLGRRRDAAKEEAEPEPAPVAATDSTLPEGTVRLMSVSTELLSVSDDEVPDETFEVPENFRQARN